MSNNIYDILKKIESLEAPKKTNLTESKMTTVKELHNESKKEKSTNKGSIAEAVAKVESQLNEKYMGFKTKVDEQIKVFHKTSPGAEMKRFDKDSPDPAAAGHRKAAADAAKAARASGQFKMSRYGGKGSETTDEVPTKKGGSVIAAKNLGEGDLEESGLQAYLGKKKYGETGMKALQKAGREGASKEKMAMIRAKHDKMDEGSYNEEMLSPKQKKIASMAGDPDKIDAKDFAALRGEKKGKKDESNQYIGNLMKARKEGKKKADLDGDGDMETVKPGMTTMREGWEEMQKYLDKKKGPQSKGGEGKKAGTRYGGSAQKDDDEDTDGEGKPVEKKKGRPKGTGGGAKFSFKKPKD